MEKEHGVCCYILAVFYSICTVVALVIIVLAVAKSIRNDYKMAKKLPKIKDGKTPSFNIKEKKGDSFTLELNGVALSRVLAFLEGYVGEHQSSFIEVKKVEELNEVGKGSNWFPDPNGIVGIETYFECCGELIERFESRGLLEKDYGVFCEKLDLYRTHFNTVWKRTTEYGVQIAGWYLLNETNFLDREKRMKEYCKDLVRKIKRENTRKSFVETCFW